MASHRSEAPATHREKILKQPPPPPTVDDATLKARAAAARAYALAGDATAKKNHRENGAPTATTTNTTTSSSSGGDRGDEFYHAAPGQAPPHYAYHGLPHYPHLPYHAAPYPQYYPHPTSPTAAANPHYPPPPYPGYYYYGGYHYPPNRHVAQPASPATHQPHQRQRSTTTTSPNKDTQDESENDSDNDNNDNDNDDSEDAGPRVGSSPCHVPTTSKTQHIHHHDDNGQHQESTTTTTERSGLRTPLSKQHRHNYHYQGGNTPASLADMPGEPFSSSNWDDDYAQFVKNLGDFDLRFDDNDDDDDEEEEEFQLMPMEDDDDDDDDEEEEDDDDGDEDEDEHDDDEAEDGKGARIDMDGAKAKTKQDAPSTTASPPANFLSESDWELDFYKELEEELGGLEEEDLEAAVATLLGGATLANKAAVTSTTLSPFCSPASAGHEFIHHHQDMSLYSVQDEATGYNTPSRKDGVRSGKAVVTSQQIKQLQLLLKRHYQMLIQQAVLAIQAAQIQKTQRIKEKTDFLSGENADDLVEIVDGAVGMLQSLEQNWKDAIRNSIQLEDTRRPHYEQIDKVGYDEQRKYRVYSMPLDVRHEQRRLTRTAFTKTLQQGHDRRRTLFDIKGLNRLQGTFKFLDQSVGAEEPAYPDACRMILEEASAEFEPDLIPGKRDLSEVLCDPREYLGEDFKKPCTMEQKLFLRRSRNLFSAGEDNLVLRGVNLYGEKQWVLIADRYLPDRSVNAISQRYSKLCVLLYKANDIHIDRDGNLIEPPKFESVDDMDEEKVSQLQQADPPAILNVHRWSLEEDLTLLKAVPLMGHMWAELGARLIPHRDRGHLRKRYQVLERRIKATVSRSLKDDEMLVKLTPKKRQQSPARQEQSPRKHTEVGQAPVPFRIKLEQEPRRTHEETILSPLAALANGSQQEADVSRFAFEDLVKESTTEWSQMSRLNEIMENEVESEIVGALASRLSNSSAPDTNDVTKTSPKPRPAIMESVLERASSASNARRKIDGQSTAESTVARQIPKPRDSPRSKRTIYSTNGTPISLSHSFQYTNTGFVPTPPSVQNRMRNAIMEENDLEAISALNSLSNSPARSIFARPVPEPKKKSGKKSLFATAVGSVHENDTKSAKKRKLNFDEKK